FAILKRDLIDCWIGEGFLDERDSFCAQNQGYYIVGTLVHACLLEEVGRGLKEAPEVKEWETVRRLSLMQNQIKILSEAPTCPHLHYETNIKELLGELKALVNLKCVNLEWARDLVTIPLEVISNFSKLRVLRLFGTDSKSIDVIALARLKHLSTLHFSKCEELEEWKTDYTSGTVLKSPQPFVFCSLHKVTITFCPKLKGLTFLVFAPNLKCLSLFDCTAMEEIISAGKFVHTPEMMGNTSSPFKMLKID
ncbi:hypothetical protein CUMW_287060, partial [Citrus unshiu]